MSLFSERQNGEGKEAVGTSANSDLFWKRVSPTPQEPRQVHPAITLHRLVARPSTVLKHNDKTTTNTFKYITPEEIKAAQIKARQEILASKMAPPPSLPTDIPASSSTPGKKQHTEKDSSNSQPSFPCRLRNGEIGLRRRQLTRLLSQIFHTLVELENLKAPHQNVFITPQELEIKRRRWIESARSMRRSLFILKQELVTLERSSQGIRSSHHLRRLAAAGRTLNTQLLALKSQAESSPGDGAWTRLLEELLGLAHRMVILAASVGVQTPTLSLKLAKLPQERVTPVPEDGNGLESTISISDVDSTNVHLLQSSHVRSRLATLASLHLQKRKKQTPQSIMRERRQNKQETVLQPLKRHVNNRRKTFLDKTPIQQSPLITCHCKKDESTRDGNTTPKNTSLDHRSRPSLPKTNVTRSQPHHPPGPSIKTNSSTLPQSLHSQSLSTQTDDILIPQSQLSPANHSSIASSETPVDTAPQTNNLKPEVRQELSSLLERVCKLEDNRRKTETLIAEASQTIPTQSNTSYLGDAIQRAKKALTTVQCLTIHSRLPIPNPAVTEGNSIPRKHGLSVKVPEEIMKKSSPAVAETHHLSSEEQEDGANLLEGKWLTRESVTEQVRRQKEQFWLSLARQGFVRPPETLSGEEIHCNVQCDNQSESYKIHHKIVSEEKSEENFDKTLIRNNVTVPSSSKKAERKAQSHQQTQTISLPEQCQSSKNNSVSNASHQSCLNTKIHQSQVKLDDSSDETKPSLSNNSQVQQSVCVDSTSSRMLTTTETDSQSFPSYEGVSSPA